MRNIPPIIVNKFGPSCLSSRETHKGTEYRYYCPFCIDNKGTPDTAGHLFVNGKSFVYYCQRCGATGHLGKNEKKIYHEDEDEFLRQERFELMDSISSVVEERSTEEIKYQYVIPIRKSWENNSSYKYLINRGFDLETQKYYDMRVSDPFSRLHGRVIIPNRVKHLVYCDMYSARSYLDQTPKYLNPIDSPKSKIVFNLHRIPKGSTIIICEGALTAIAAGKNAVALYGKSCSTEQMKLILSNSPRSIYVNLDPDAEDKEYELCSKLYYQVSVPVFRVRMPEGKDAADMTKSEYYHILLGSEEFNLEKTMMLDLLN